MRELNLNRLQDVTKRLKKISDYILLDSAAGLGDEAKAAIRASDEVIIITNPEISAVTDALKTIKVSQDMKKKVLGVIITRHQNDNLEMTIDSIKDMLEVPLLGIIPEDRAVRIAQHAKNAVVHTHPKSRVAKAYQKTARRILGSEFMKDAEKIEKKTEGFFRRLWKKLREIQTGV
jgi:septum site-determining protein MinD